jgi:hypothetical protein
VVATFRSNGHPNPTRDTDGQLAWILAHQYRAYKLDDPKEVQEKAIPLCVLFLIALKTSSDLQQAITQLTLSAFFFACRSCEYLKVKKPEEKLTKQLLLRNIAFY